MNSEGEPQYCCGFFPSATPDLLVLLMGWTRKFVKGVGCFLADAVLSLMLPEVQNQKKI